MRLSSYPYVVVRIACRLCRRRGEYRLARLAETHGAEIELEALRRRLTEDCSAWRQTGKRRRIIEAEDCRAMFPDLDAPPPPDVPPDMAGLRVIEGGKDALDDLSPPVRRRRKAAE